MNPSSIAQPIDVFEITLVCDAHKWLHVDYDADETDRELATDCMIRFSEIMCECVFVCVEAAATLNGNSIIRRKVVHTHVQCVSVAFAGPNSHMGLLFHVVVFAMYVLCAFVLIRIIKGAQLVWQCRSSVNTHTRAENTHKYANKHTNTRHTRKRVDIMLAALLHLFACDVSNYIGGRLASYYMYVYIYI